METETMIRTEALPSGLMLDTAEGRHLAPETREDGEMRIVLDEGEARIEVPRDRADEFVQWLDETRDRVRTALGQAHE